MSEKKLLQGIIEASEVSEFNKIVKSYLKEVYKYERVVNTDGKDDMGLDIRVFDCGSSKSQYQITIQTSDNPQKKNNLKIKIFNDVGKAKTNFEKYGYNNNLFYFYSHVLTNKIKNEYERQAFEKDGINLKIIDANQIAEESDDHITLQSAIYQTSNFNRNSGCSEKEIPKSTNLIFDLISFGKTSDIKLDIVISYMIGCLYDKKELTSTEIANLCKEKFLSGDNNTFYVNLINRLHKENRLIYSKSLKKYSLSENERQKVITSMCAMDTERQQFLDKISAVLKNYNQDQSVDDYVKALCNLYTENFNKRISLSQNIDRVETDQITKFAKNKFSGQGDYKTMITQLLQVCDKNKYLQKLCASNIFSNSVNLDNLQTYARFSKKVYIDTNIALHLLCYFFDKDLQYENYYYNLSKSFYEYCHNNGISLYITNIYLEEITTHIREALILVPFTRLISITSLGKSKNVFYSHYYFLQGEEKYSNLLYGDYLEKFGFSSSASNATIYQLIKEYLSDLGINVMEISKRYNIQNSSRIIGNQLSVSQKHKTELALNHDAIMLNYLGDNDVAIHSVTPIFITWDSVLFKVLQKFFETNPGAQRWMQFTPSQFIDRYSLLSFSITTETMTKEILATLSGDIVQDTYFLLDSLSLILNPNEEVGLEYTRRFTKMKDSQIYTTDKSSNEQQDNSGNDSIDRVLLKIALHYRRNETDNKNLKILFSSEYKIDSVCKVIEESVKYYDCNNTFDENTFTKLDNLINSLELPDVSFNEKS